MNTFLSVVLFVWWMGVWSKSVLFQIRFSPLERRLYQGSLEALVLTWVIQATHLFIAAAIGLRQVCATASDLFFILWQLGQANSLKHYMSSAEAGAQNNQNRVVEAHNE